MDFRVLGPVVVYSDDGREISLGGPKQRSVLGLLVARAGRVVDTDLIVEELYPDLGPRANRKTVQVYVSRLRSGFAEHGAGEVIQPRGNGYELATDGHTVDAQRFEAALRRARTLVAADPDEASRLLEEVLGLWRGRPFEDAHPTQDLDLEASRLEEQRLVALETRAEAELAAGRHTGVVADLQRLTEEHPLREALWGLLMLALYRSGRQAEALRAYAELETRLGEELGIEPSKELIELEGKMLLQDPELDAPPRASKPPPAARRRSTSWPIIGIAAAALAVVLAAIAALFLSSADEPAGPRRGFRYAVPEGTTEMVAAGGKLWMIAPEDAAVTAFDPSGADTTRHELAAPPSAFAAGLGSIWVASEDAGAIFKVSVDDGRTISTAEGLELDGAALAVGSDAVFVVREHDQSFLEIDPTSLEVETIAFTDGLGGPAEPSITTDGPVVWAANSFIGRIMRLDPETGVFDFAGDPRTSEHSARSILSNLGGVWYSQPTNGSVTLVDAATSEVLASAQIGRSGGAGFGSLSPPYGLAAGPGGVWVALPQDGKVVLVHDSTAEVLGELGFDRPVSVAATVEQVWVLDAEESELVQVIPASCDEAPFIGAGADLRGCELVAKALVGVDLSGADLRWANLRRSALQGVDFTGADLYGADLSGTGIEGVTWSGTRCPDGWLSDAVGGTCAGHLLP